MRPARTTPSSLPSSTARSAVGHDQLPGEPVTAWMKSRGTCGGECGQAPRCAYDVTRWISTTVAPRCLSVACSSEANPA